MLKVCLQSHGALGNRVLNGGKTVLMVRALLKVCLQCHGALGQRDLHGRKTLLLLRARLKVCQGGLGPVGKRSQRGHGAPGKNMQHQAGLRVLTSEIGNL